MSDKQGGPGKWVVVLAVVVVGGAGAAYFFSTRDDAAKVPVKPGSVAPANAAAPANGTTPAPDAAPAAAAPQLSVAELLKNGSAAVAEGRLVEPVGNNAIESYLGVLEQQPDNRAARDALLEIFPLATTAVERQINADHIDDATRSIALLTKADKDNYALNILRSKVETRRKQDEKDQEKAQAAKDARNAPASTAATAAATAPPTPPPATTAPPPVAAAPTPAPVAAPPVQAPAPVAAPVGETRAAALTQRVSPNYPPDAARKHTEGWVEVSFTVGPDGHVKNAVVVSANPSRVFDNAALQAVANWVFSPRLEAGKPVEQQIKSRIEFKL